MEGDSSEGGAVTEIRGSPHGIDAGSSFEEGAVPEKFPGCLKKTLAFVVDTIIISLIGVVIFFPFSAAIDSLAEHAWLAVVFSGDTIFMLLHPQKRGLHDILSGSVISKATHEGYLQVTEFSLKPNDWWNSRHCHSCYRIWCYA